ncbi:MAG TPA: hypothetical protein PK760_08780, partial [Flavobacteriales bacterium]|nr:hypothetical protein [Flavobacteriales bacterium]
MKTALRILFLSCLLQAFSTHAQTYCSPTYTSDGALGIWMDSFVLGSISDLGSGLTPAPSYTDNTYSGPTSMTTLVPGA